MKHYLKPQDVQAQIAAHRARLVELRAQRPFCGLGRSNVVDIAPRRLDAFPLVGVSK